jgi:hypothetical protein
MRRLMFINEDEGGGGEGALICRSIDLVRMVAEVEREAQGERRLGRRYEVNFDGVPICRDLLDDL